MVMEAITDGEIIDIYFTDALNGFAVTYDGKIFKTTDGGVNWSVKYDNPSVYDLRGFVHDKCPKGLCCWGIEVILQDMLG